MNHFTSLAARVCPQQALLAPCPALPAVAALQLSICMSPLPAVAHVASCMQFRWPSVLGMQAAHQALWYPQGLRESMLWRSALTALQSLGQWAMERCEVPGPLGLHLVQQPVHLLTWCVHADCPLGRAWRPGLSGSLWRQWVLSGEQPADRPERLVSRFLSSPEHVKWTANCCMALQPCSAPIN